jgi:hypothetical protein
MEEYMVSRERKKKSRRILVLLVELTNEKAA